MAFGAIDGGSNPPGTILQSTCNGPHGESREEILVLLPTELGGQQVLRENRRLPFGDDR